MSATVGIDSMDSTHQRNVSCHLLCPHFSRSPNSQVLQSLLSSTQFFKEELYGVHACMHIQKCLPDYRARKPGGNMSLQDIIYESHIKCKIF